MSLSTLDFGSSEGGSRVRPGWILWLTATSTAGVVLFGVFAMLNAPRVPYADGWRFLAHFLSEPFPGNVLGSDNGHFELFPDLVRVIELHLMAADQTLQIGVGILLALLSWVLAAFRGWHATYDAPVRAWAIALVLALGLFWLGNFRALTHANETVHAYAVTLGLFAGIASAWRGGTRGATIAGLAAAFASLSFGSGLAVFPALLLVLTLRRAPWREYAPLTISLMAVVSILYALRDGTAQSVVAFDPLGGMDALLRWLGGPMLYASLPLWDPEISQHLPVAAVRDALTAFAHGYEQAAGDVMSARWPHLFWGLLGLAGWLVALFRSWREPRALRIVGAAVATFGVCVGAMIVLVRSAYFESHPDQLLAPRYVVWSSLFWAGLGVVLLDALRPQRAALLALCLCAMSLPSQVWMYELAVRQTEVAERTALAAAAGVVSPELPLGETVPDDLARALPLLEAKGAAIFDWPEARWLGRAPGSLHAREIAVRLYRSVSVDNRLGGAGWRVEFALEGAWPERLLLMDADGVVRGLARREPEGHWLGWMRGDARPEQIKVAQLLRE